ncbi:MAG: hypothetical protein N0E48_11585, partial [Candidatus Thiodiazotropha endolucinida]|nr:hypothetical protein [Candidatus Thiodiazotropha taylori]MCW4343983.1 hypothetical protein [Candidatus Thiodiazotropha endolucinida]
LVNRNTMFLDKSQGGVNMLNIHNLQMSKQIKCIYKIIMSERAHWNMIGKHWLQKLDFEFDDSFFICLQVLQVYSENPGLHVVNNKDI